MHKSIWAQRNPGFLGTGYAISYYAALTRATCTFNGIVVVNNNQKVVDYNVHFVEMWDLPAELIESKDYNAIQALMLSLQLNPEVFSEFINHFNTVPLSASVVVLKLTDGRYFECYSQQQKVNEIAVGRVWSFRDITQRVELEAKFEYQDTHDELTSLPNRLLLLDRMQQGIARADRHNTLFCIMFIDLDRFKLVNDSFSHVAGDFLLKNISSRLSSIIRHEDTIARLSGDEFILISLTEPGFTTEDIINFATKVLTVISKNLKIDNRDILKTLV